MELTRRNFLKKGAVGLTGIVSVGLIEKCLGGEYETNRKTNTDNETSLIKGDGKKYWDKYVAMDGFNSHKIIAYGKDAGKVIDDARKAGVEVPVVVYVPNPNISYIY